MSGASNRAGAAGGNALVRAWRRTWRARATEVAVVEAGNGAAATFAELEAGAVRWRAAHVPPAAELAGRAVVFAAPNGIGWLEMFLALQQAGAVAVPLDAGEPPAAQERLADALRAGFRWDGVRLVARPRARRYRDPETCLIKLTSGSTGRPRALVFTAAQMLADARQVTATMGITPRERNYALIPLGHSYGLGNLTIPLLAQGIPLVCGSAPLPQAVAADFARWAPTVLPGVPAMWRALAQSDVALPTLRLGISAGAPLAPEVAREFFARTGTRLHTFYGSSETGGIAYDRDGRAALAGGVGRAMRGVRLAAARGGRIRVSSGAVFTHGNRRRVGECGAHVMADRVAADGAGGLTLRGRAGTTVKLAGRRVDLAEVTAALRRLPGVRDAWVGAGGEPEPVLGAVVATERTPAELRVALQMDTAAWKIPKRWRVVSELPVTARGKVDARGLHGSLFGAARFAQDRS
jgi:long-chain acyl-CoA synthetase